MKANWKRTLLSLVLCAGFVWPAGAVSTGQPAASQTGTSTAQSKPAAYTVKKMGLLGVKRTVESDNNTVKMLNKTAASLDSSSYMSGSASSATGESEIAIYAALIEDMKKAMDGLDKTSDLYKTYAAQLKVLEDYQTSLNQNAVSGMQQAMAMGVSIPKPVIKNHSRYSLPSKERGCTRLRTDRMIPRDDDSAWWIVGAMIVAACFFVFLCEIGVIP